MLMRLDVGIVGFVLFTLIGPLLGGYLAAWLIGSVTDATPGDAFAALFSGGTDRSASPRRSAPGPALG